MNLAGTLTGRITPSKVAMGTMSPNIVGARVIAGLNGSAMSVLHRRVPMVQLNGPRSITGTISFLTSSGSSCVAKRVVSMGNNVIV